MKDGIVKIISKASSFSTVLWLLGSCLIMWYYVLPSARIEVLQEYKCINMVNRGIQWLFIDQNMMLSNLTKEVTSFSLRAELTAGMLENILTYAFFLTLLVLIWHRNNKFILPFKYILLLPCFGFLADLLESVFIITAFIQSFEFALTITWAKVFSLLKWLFYFLNVMAIICYMVIHSDKGKVMVRSKNL